MKSNFEDLGPKFGEPIPQAPCSRELHFDPASPDLYMWWEGSSDD